MNIISTSCVAARIYQQMEKEYDNPFAWASLEGVEFLRLVQNYDKINFNEFTLDVKPKHPWTTVWFDPSSYNIETFYIHYRQDDTRPVVKHAGINIIGPKEGIEEFMRFKLTKRQSGLKEPPVFILDALPKILDDYSKWQFYSKELIKKFMTLETPYKKFLLSLERDCPEEYLNSPDAIIFDDYVDTNVRAQACIEKWSDIFYN